MIPPSDNPFGTTTGDGVTPCDPLNNGDCAYSPADNARLKIPALGDFVTGFGNVGHSLTNLVPGPGPASGQRSHLQRGLHVPRSEVVGSGRRKLQPRRRCLQPILAGQRLWSGLVRLPSPYRGLWHLRSALRPWTEALREFVRGGGRCHRRLAGLRPTCSSRPGTASPRSMTATIAIRLFPATLPPALSMPWATSMPPRFVRSSPAIQGSGADRFLLEPERLPTAQHGRQPVHAGRSRRPQRSLWTIDVRRQSRRAQDVSTSVNASRSNWAQTSTTSSTIRCSRRIIKDGGGCEGCFANVGTFNLIRRPVAHPATPGITEDPADRHDRFRSILTEPGLRTSLSQLRAGGHHQQSRDSAERPHHLLSQNRVTHTRRAGGYSAGPPVSSLLQLLFRFRQLKCLRNALACGMWQSTEASTQSPCGGLGGPCLRNRFARKMVPSLGCLCHQ